MNSIFLNVANPWKFYGEEHDKVVRKLQEVLGGEVFRRAPFDLVSGDGRFIEVKVNYGTSKRNQGRIKITNEEAKFSQIKNLWLLVVLKKFNLNLLLPASIVTEKIKRNKTQSWANGAKLSHGLMGQNIERFT